MTDPRLKSIYPLYMAFARGDVAGFTVPAFNLRGMTEDLAAGIFRAAQDTETGAFVIELARSEMGYTGQNPQEFANRVLTGAKTVGWTKTIFLQGDHFQDKALSPGVIAPGEVEAIQKLIDASFAAGIYNIDIDASTLVDLSQPDILAQQRTNGELTALFTRYIREHQPDGITVSVGGEIGHIGDKNSTEEELDAFMEVFLAKHPQSLPGISKLSVQTGTSHGGKISPDGKMEMMEVDFDVLAKLSAKARVYGMAGAVQHGASTLPTSELTRFPQLGAVEIHLATGWQNMIYSMAHFPHSLGDEINAWITQEKGSERKANETDVQFFYRMRKYAWGTFRQKFDNLPREFHTEIQEEMKSRCIQVFEELKVDHTQELIEKYI